MKDELQMNEGMDHFELEPEGLPSDFEPELVEVDAKLRDLLTRVEVPSGLEARVYSASVKVLAVGSPEVSPRSYSLADVLRSRWTGAGRLAMAASVGIACVVGSWMLRNGEPGQDDRLADGGAATDAGSETGAVMLASLESMSTDSVGAVDGGLLWAEYDHQQFSFEDVNDELGAMMQALGEPM